MDRFIALEMIDNFVREEHLKSNMDRFIVVDNLFTDLKNLFKIQYG